ncbi:MAG: SDR family NAD(P)-dependent oxidoreductase [bacterium]|nr:SDR family NAD(P)-dependent oxidoreductase [bacterium]
MSQRRRVAVVTGGNRGLGLAAATALTRHGLTVVIGSRDRGDGEAAARGIGGDAVALPLDVRDAAGIAGFARAVDARFGGADVLVNNAGIYPDENRSVLAVPPALFRETMETNLLGPVALCQAFVPGMRARGYGRVVNVSSGLGQLATMGDVAPSYAASKAALNALTRLVAGAVAGSNVLVNAADPGWVRTRMGGEQAPRSIPEGIDTIVWLATLPDGGPSGGFFRDRQPLAW